MNKKDVKDILTWLGIAVLGGSLVAGGTMFVFDAIDSHHAKISEGLPLLHGGIHLKKGEHKVVITDQFYKLLSYDTPQEDQDLVVNAFKEAYKNLNKYNTGVNFKLCTTSEEASEKFNLPITESFKNDDIKLYATDGIINNNKNVLAATDWDYDFFTYEMKDLSINFKKDKLFSVWKVYDTVEETLSPYNAAAYTVAAHETMHAMGFAHVDDEESIMNTYVKYKSPKDFTEYDKKIMDKYNVVFYGATATYSENVKNKTENSLQFDDYTSDMSM